MKMDEVKSEEYWHEWSHENETVSVYAMNFVMKWKMTNVVMKWDNGNTQQRYQYEGKEIFQRRQLENKYKYKNNKINSGFDSAPDLRKSGVIVRRVTLSY